MKVLETMSDQDLGPSATSASQVPDSAVQPIGHTRTHRKRHDIVEAATRLFLEQGYQGTSMDEIAAAAEVSKQTVYKQYVDKQQLFAGIVLGITERAEGIAETIAHLFDEIGAGDEVVDLEVGLVRLARVYAAAVVNPQVLQLRRLVISEADQFPELAQAYYERAPGRGLEAIEMGLRRLVDRGLLRIDDLATAAGHFAYLILGPIIDKALFHPHSKATESEIEYRAVSGVRVFLAAYT
jgi:TetR/AcrR family transcriptional repressor of mexJK operon